MKAEGVEYEERMAELEKLEYPKPQPRLHLRHVQRLRATRTRGSAHENIRPKSIAREMFEGFASFADYVREYGLERSEGVLLRYLSQVYKTLSRPCPRRRAPRRSMDIAAYFRTLLRDVDSSLLDEWELLAHPDLAFATAQGGARGASAGRSGGRAARAAGRRPRRAAQAGARARAPRLRHGGARWCSRATTVRRGRPSGSRRRWRRSSPRTPSC